MVRAQPKVFLLIIAVVPIIFFLALFDSIALGGALRDVLPYSPYTLSAYLLLFGLPHIVSSLITFGVKDHVVAHKQNLFLALMLAMAVILLVPYFFSLELAIWLMISYNIYHVMMQQAGVGVALIKQKPTSIYKLWSFLNFAALWLAGMQWWGYNVQSNVGNIQPLVWGLIILNGFITVYLIHFYIGKKGAPSGVLYLACNGCIVPVCYALLLLGYPLLSILAVTFNHQASAAYVYGMHSHNSKISGYSNWMLKMFSWTGIPWAFLIILLGVVIAAPITFMRTDIYILLLVSMSLEIMHYYMEGRMWKRDAPHRAFVTFD